MNDKQHVVFNSLEIVRLQISIIFELFEAVKVIDLAAKDKNERLHFTYELIGQVDFGDVGLLVLKLIIHGRGVVRLEVLLQLICARGKLLDDINLIIHAMLVLFRLRILGVDAAEFLAEYLTQDCNWMLPVVQNVLPQ